MLSEHGKEDDAECVLQVAKGGSSERGAFLAVTLGIER